MSFSVPGSIQDTTFFLVIKSPLVWEFFSAFLCCSWLWQLWKELVGYFVESPQFRLVQCVSQDQAGLTDFREEEHYSEMLCSSQRIRGRDLSWLLPGDGNIDQLVQVVLARFHCTLITFVSICYFWKWVTKPSPHTKGSTYVYYLQNSSVRKICSFPPLPLLAVQSFISTTMGSCKFTLYFRL